VKEYGEHPPIGVLAVGDVEPEEQAPDMGLDGPFADEQALGNTRDRHPLRHQGEHLALTFGELGEPVLASASIEQRGDDVGVECGASLGDPSDGPAEVREFRTRSFSR
jgi:hypothetical protein